MVYNLTPIESRRTICRGFLSFYMTGPGFSILMILIIAVLLIFSAFFSSSEIAIFSIDTEWIKDKKLEGIKNADILDKLREDPHRLLVTILVGNNIVNIAIASIITSVLVGYLPKGQAVTATTITAILLILIFGEIIPKSYGIKNPQKWALKIAKPIKYIEKILYPLITILDFITRKINKLIDGGHKIEKIYLKNKQ